MTARRLLWLSCFIACCVMIAADMASAQSLTGAGLFKPTAGGASPTWTPTDNPAGQNVISTTVTFSSANIGTASSDRIVVVISNTLSSVPTSVTIGGISATKAVEESASISGLQIWYASVPTGTTANVVLTSGSNMGSETIIVGKLTGVTSAPSGTGTYPSNSANPASLSVTVPATGFAIIGAYPFLTGSQTWTGATVDFETQDASSVFLVEANASATGTVTATNVFTAVHMVWAAWGP